MARSSKQDAFESGLSPAKRRALAKAVVDYFRRESRELPWRESKDAYRIWISEIMLQQTRVAAVIPYFEAWVARFPRIEDLASSELDDVLAQWSGLGYYSRARNIHRCAKDVVADYAGRLPQEAEALRKLPGIGPYTAGAISSIAYGQREALVDGNVARVMARVFAIEDNIKGTAAMKKVWSVCRELVPADAPSEFNQGLMEIGALICVPKTPRCGECPIRSQCRAHAEARTDALPVVPKRKADRDKPLLASEAAFAVRGRELLLAQRRPEGLYGGLWELPQADARGELDALTGLSFHFASEAPGLIHEQVLSHRRLQISVFASQAKGRIRLASDAAYQRLEWHPIDSLQSLGLSSATQAILDRRAELLRAKVA